MAKTGIQWAAVVLVVMAGLPAVFGIGYMTGRMAAVEQRMQREAEAGRARLYIMEDGRVELLRDREAAGRAVSPFVVPVVVPAGVAGGGDVRPMFPRDGEAGTAGGAH